MMLRYSMQPIRNMTRLKNQPVAPISSTPPSEAPSTATGCVATAAISHSPLMPAAIGGLVDRTMTAVKKAYITRTQRKIPSPHSHSAGPATPPTSSTSAPSTQVLATKVKKLGPRPWSTRSPTSFVGKQASRVAKSDHSAAQVATLKPSRSEENTSELQSIMRISYADYGLKQKTQ